MQENRYQEILKLFVLSKNFECILTLPIKLILVSVILIKEIESHLQLSTIKFIRPYLTHICKQSQLNRIKVQ